jgi:hypothetical protein
MKKISLKEYFNYKIQNIEKATSLASASIDKRLESMNEFRSALKDQASKFLTKDEYGLTINRVEIDLRSLREDRARLEGKASMSSVYISYIIGLAGIIIGLLSIFEKV